MKISIGAVIALAAASASGFSITMSSYLDNLAAGSTLTSFAPSGGAATAYAPAPSYAAPVTPAASNGFSAPPAPAPATYKSSLADYPASSVTNYISTIGGGSQMKSGPNYSGVSRAFQSTSSGAGYLENLKEGGVTSFANGASAPANGSFAPLPAPAAPYQSSFASPPAPAPYQSSSIGSAPAATTLNYIGSIGGGSQMKAGPNYSGVSRSFQSTSSGAGYLDNLKEGGVTSFANGASAPANGSFAPAASYQSSPPAPAPYQSSSIGSAPAATTLNYIGSIGGGSQMKAGPNFTGMSSTFQPTTSVSNSVYLENLKGSSLSSFANGASAPANGYAAPAPPAYQSSFSAPAPAPPAYQSSFAPAPYGGRSSYMPQPSGRVANTGIGSYLDAL